ncbi:MAG: hypothetical protein P8L41_09475, partial [Paracoccaceae bacterium]|nr:hypothetical protein [Paracoccaceae bacterium]
VSLNTSSHFRLNSVSCIIAPAFGGSAKTLTPVKDQLFSTFSNYHFETLEHFLLFDIEAIALRGCKEICNFSQDTVFL